jgi:hypothetical protein
MHPPIIPQRRHPHNLNHQARPARKMLGALPLACLRVILLPGKPRLRPRFENCLDKIVSEAAV